MDATLRVSRVVQVSFKPCAVFESYVGGPEGVGSMQQKGFLESLVRQRDPYLNLFVNHYQLPGARKVVFDMKYGPEYSGRFFRVRIPLSKCVVINLIQYSTESMVESREEALGSEMLCEELSGELCAQLKAIEAS